MAFRDIKKVKHTWHFGIGRPDDLFSDTLLSSSLIQLLGNVGRSNANACACSPTVFLPAVALLICLYLFLAVKCKRGGFIVKNITQEYKNMAIRLQKTKTYTVVKTCGNNDSLSGIADNNRPWKVLCK